MTPTSQVLTDALALTAVDPEVYDEAFVATTQYCPWPKAYGGDMVAQAAVAAMRSVGDDRTMHSMHSYFMRPVDIGAQITYEVERLRDGRAGRSTSPWPRSTPARTAVSMPRSRLATSAHQRRCPAARHTSMTWSRGRRLAAP